MAPQSARSLRSNLLYLLTVDQTTTPDTLCVRWLDPGLPPETPPRPARGLDSSRARSIHGVDATTAWDI